MVLPILVIPLLLYGQVTVCSDVTSIELGDGNKMPAIGFGTWHSEGDKLVEAIKHGFQVGYRHIDTAWFFNNGKDIGRAIKESIDEGIVKRDDLFIAYKVWPKNSNFKRTLKAINNALSEMGTDYFDLVTIQWPINNNSEIYAALEKAQDDKLTRSIGVSNFKPHEIERLMSTARNKPAINQIRIHPGFSQELTVDYCHEKGIAVSGWSPLGTGSLVKHPLILDIAKKYKKSAAQVMIRWQIQRRLAVVPKSTTNKNIEENFKVFDFQLTPEDMSAISEMPQVYVVDFWASSG